MLAEHRPLGEALGARGLDIVEPHDVQEAAPRHPRHGAGMKRPQRERGQYQVREIAPAVARDREPVEAHREHERQHHAEPEDRGRDAEHGRPHQRVVQAAAGAGRGRGARAHAHDDRDERRRQGQAHRGRQAVGDDLGHRTLLAVRAAEVAAEEASDPRRVLHDERAVERVLVAKLPQDLGVGALPERRAGGIAERDRVEREHEQRDAEQHRPERQEALRDRADNPHRRPLLTGRARPCGAAPGTRAPTTRATARGPARTA